MPQDGNGRERESLLGILRQHRFYYLWTFITLTLAWLIFAGWWQVEQGFAFARIGRGALTG